MEGHLTILDQSGDTKIIWDATKPGEVEVAKDTFDKLIKQGYFAYEVVGKDASKGKQIKKFDPAAESIILAPPPVGG